jgi:hypothetical protein
LLRALIKECRLAGQGRGNRLHQHWSDIERIVVHESYKPDTSENDIALIKLKAPAAGRVIPLAGAS